MFTQRDQCTPLAGASGRHVQKFGHFREFLAGNRNALRSLAELVLNAVVPEELVASMLMHYRAIEQRTRPGIRLAMRSSAVREDSDASFAGQYRSVLNVAGDDLADAYGRCL
jgi:pyruvate, water dikinase